MSLSLISTNSDAEGRAALRDRGLRVEQIAPASERIARQIRLPAWVSSARRDEHMAELARTLALLLRGGVTLTTVQSRSNELFRSVFPHESTT